jgi:hypothetical protein
MELLVSSKKANWMRLSVGTKSGLDFNVAMSSIGSKVGEAAATSDVFGVKTAVTRNNMKAAQPTAAASQAKVEVEVGNFISGDFQVNWIPQNSCHSPKEKNATW